jgi:hypothetical protein
MISSVLVSCLRLDHTNENEQKPAKKVLPVPLASSGAGGRGRQNQERSIMVSAEIESLSMPTSYRTLKRYTFTKRYPVQQRLSLLKLS